MCTIFYVFRILYCFIAKSLFYAIYAVLSRNLFCRNLHAFAWRKIVPVEKNDKYQVCFQDVYMQYTMQNNAVAAAHVSHCTKCWTFDCRIVLQSILPLVIAKNKRPLNLAMAVSRCKRNPQ